MENIELKVSHLTFIQDIITRMGKNSFFLKGWSITLISAFLAISSQSDEKEIIIISYIPLFMFWYLDAFFLHQEKLYRKLYNKVAENEISSEKLTLNTFVVAHKCPSFIKVFISKTLITFHGILLLSIIALTAITI